MLNSQSQVWENILITSFSLIYEQTLLAQAHSFVEQALDTR